MKSDREIVESVTRRHRREDFGELMRRHSAMVYAKALSVVRHADFAAEVTQETFIRAYTHLGEWSGDGSIGPWLAAIAMRLSINNLDCVRRRRVQALDGDAPATNTRTSTSKGSQPWKRPSTICPNRTAPSSDCTSTASAIILTSTVPIVAIVCSMLYKRHQGANKVELTRIIAESHMDYEMTKLLKEDKQAIRKSRPFTTLRIGATLLGGGLGVWVGGALGDWLGNVTLSLLSGFCVGAGVGLLVAFAVEWKKGRNSAEAKEA